MILWKESDICRQMQTEGVNYYHKDFAHIFYHSRTLKKWKVDKSHTTIHSHRRFFLFSYLSPFVGNMIIARALLAAALSNDFVRLRLQLHDPKLTILDKKWEVKFSPRKLFLAETKLSRAYFLERYFYLNKEHWKTWQTLLWLYCVSLMHV